MDFSSLLGGAIGGSLTIVAKWYLDRLGSRSTAHLARLQSEFDTNRSKMEQLHQLLSDVADTFASVSTQWANVSAARRYKQDYEIPGSPDAPTAKVDLIVEFYFPQLRDLSVQLTHRRSDFYKRINELMDEVQNDRLIPPNPLNDEFQRLYEAVLELQYQVAEIHRERVADVLQRPPMPGEAAASFLNDAKAKAQAFIDEVGSRLKTRAVSRGRPSNAGEPVKSPPEDAKG